MTDRKKELGQFFTARDIASVMVKWVTKNKPGTLLDPAAGYGVFLSTAKQMSPESAQTAYEIDSSIAPALRNDSGARVINCDYLTDFFAEKYDAIVCNPPYNRFQNVKNRKAYIKSFADKYGVKLSGYTNHCVYFLIKSIFELSAGGRCCYIMPYEFLNNGYGAAVKQLLCSLKVVHSIAKIDSELSLFDDAITTSCLVFIENKPHDGIRFINICSKDELNALDADSRPVADEPHYLPYSKIDPDIKWNAYFSGEESYGEDNNGLMAPFGSFCRVSRGIATGCNSFFALNAAQAESLGLSPEVCVPCIAKSPDVTVPVFTDEAFEKLRLAGKKVFLFDGTGARLDSDLEYIRTGEEQGADKTYLTSHRDPWYAPEKRPPAPIWISVFSRDKIKIVRNEAGVKNLTTFHGIYFKDDTSEDDINILFCYLLTPVAQELLRKNRREYGDGLDKFEPGDLNNAFVLNPKHIDMLRRRQILNIYKEIKNNSDTDNNIRRLNDLFLEIICSERLTVKSAV